MAIGDRDLVLTGIETRMAALAKTLATIVSTGAPVKRKFACSWHGHAMCRP